MGKRSIIAKSARKPIAELIAGSQRGPLLSKYYPALLIGHIRTHKPNSTQTLEGLQMTMRWKPAAR